ncbi:hypothetical protein OUZ56_020527 [Daphnia magna]|uniref:Decaprenyl-diphosphate synthase subunit n=1 Tax=Daphnia magna TaxID=35525 RepID=A0ABQ9ZFS5_9CRUS|nr:hypothetical protein OUZ56_020527 [Daphnia magna]
MTNSVQNELVYELVTKMVADLVNGELLQLDGSATEDERFAHYLEKTFKKTASLTAHSCQSVSVLAGADTALQNIAFQFGRQLGIAFQLVDDVLDLATDLREGLATAPVLFAAYQFPELNPLIRRRFNQPKDVETAYRLVHRSDGLQRAKQLASQYCDDAVAQLARLSPSSYQQILYSLILRNLVNLKIISVETFSPENSEFYLLVLFRLILVGLKLDPTTASPLALQKWSLDFKCQIKNCFYADVLEFAMERIWTSRDKSGLALQDAANSLPAFDVVICSRMHQVVSWWVCRSSCWKCGIRVALCRCSSLGSAVVIICRRFLMGLVSRSP